MPRHPELNVDIEGLGLLSRAELRALWTQVLAEKPPPCLGRDVLALGIAHAMQERRYGGLTKAVSKELDRLLAQALGEAASDPPPRPTSPLPRTGTVLVREWQGTTHHVTIVNDGFLWNGHTHRIIEPDRQISRIRLSDKTSRLCFRVQRHLQFLNTFPEFDRLPNLQVLHHVLRLS